MQKPIVPTLPIRQPKRKRIFAIRLTDRERAEIEALAKQLKLPDSFMARHFIIVTGADGTVYATNALVPLIYQVDMQGNASIFIADERLFDPASGLGLNGIEYHPDGYIIASLTLVAGISSTVTGQEASALFKIPIDNPAELTHIEVNEWVFADGIIWQPNGDLVVSGGIYDDYGGVRFGVFVLHSEDEWQTAAVVRHAYDERFASTVAIRNEEIYKIYLPFELMGSEPSPEVFEIARVVFEEDSP
jgi:hypothetical protein